MVYLLKKRRYGSNRQKKDFQIVEISEKAKTRQMSCFDKEKLSKMLVIGGEICQKTDRNGIPNNG